MHLGSEGIYGMLHIVEGDIGDKAVLEKEKIDAVVNALIDWMTRDPEMFELSGIEKVYFFIDHKNSIVS